MIEPLSTIGGAAIRLIVLVGIVALWYEASKEQPRPNIGRY